MEGKTSEPYDCTLPSRLKKNNEKNNKISSRDELAENTNMRELDMIRTAGDFIEDNYKEIFEAAEKINDVLRYTAVFNESEFTDGYFRVIDALQKKGYNVVKVKNTFQKGVAYKGINLQLEYEGYKLELQFHTPKSFELKNGKLHELYEAYRQLDRTKDFAKLDALQAQMIQLSDTIKVPKGVEKIG